MRQGQLLLRVDSMSTCQPIGRRSILALAGAASAAIALPTQAAQAAVAVVSRKPWQRLDAVPGSNVLITGGVLRFDEDHGWVSKGTPYLHRNAAHAAPGIKSVELADDGAVRIHQTITDPHRYPIAAAMATPDETLGGRMGIIVGATRGTGSTDFHFFDTRIGRRLDFTVRADRERIESRVSNLWLAFIHIDANKWGTGN